MMNVTENRNPFILIVGPTGVGKSDFANDLALSIGNGEIVNADLGQFYTPLTIGTAKPYWRDEKIPHHGYDVIHDPVDYNILSYRSSMEQLFSDLGQKGKTPVVVGGSSFYWNALFFPPHAHLDDANKHRDVQMENRSSSWEDLHKIDPLRAAMLHPHDSYRINRAMMIWQRHGIVPSALMPTYKPISTAYHIIYLHRERQDLYSRIDARVHIMMQQGWVQEVAGLDSKWRSFIRKKKIIGYDDILSYEVTGNMMATIQDIQQRTRNYAKRQEIYWRSWKKKLDQTIPERYSEIVLSGEQYATERQQLIARLKKLTTNNL